MVWLAREEAEAQSVFALGFHGYVELHLDDAGKAGHWPIRLNPVRMLIGVSHNDHFGGSRIPVRFPRS